MSGENAYENTRRVVYGEGATFVPVCQQCGRYVTADATLLFNKLDGSLKPGPNATCKKCGRTEMLFEGFI